MLELHVIYFIFFFVLFFAILRTTPSFLKGSYQDRKRGQYVQLWCQATF